MWVRCHTVVECLGVVLLILVLRLLLILLRLLRCWGLSVEPLSPPLCLVTPSFYGEPDPDVAGRWLDQVTRNLDTSGSVAEHTRVSFAAHQLKDDAYHWGRRVQDRVGDDDRVFETVFLDQCFPEAAREERQQQFRELRQERLSVAGFESRFTALSRFAPEMVAAEANRCRRFERGLRALMLDRVFTLRIRVYSKMVDTAVAVERGLREAARLRENRSRPSSVAGPSESRDSKRPRSRGFYRPPTQHGGPRQAASVASVGPVVANGGQSVFFAGSQAIYSVTARAAEDPRHHRRRAAGPARTVSRAAVRAGVITAVRRDTC